MYARPGVWSSSMWHCALMETTPEPPQPWPPSAKQFEHISWLKIGDCDDYSDVQTLIEEAIGRGLQRNDVIAVMLYSDEWSQALVSLTLLYSNWQLNCTVVLIDHSHQGKNKACWIHQPLCCHHLVLMSLLESVVRRRTPTYAIWRHYVFNFTERGGATSQLPQNWCPPTPIWMHMNHDQCELLIDGLWRVIWCGHRHWSGSNRDEHGASMMFHPFKVTIPTNMTCNVYIIRRSD